MLGIPVGAFCFVIGMPIPLAAEELEARSRLTTLLGLLGIVFISLWWLLIGMAANRRAEEKLRRNAQLATSCVVFVAGGFLLGPFFISSPEIFVLSLFLPIATIAAITYLLVFAARSIVIAERQSAAVSFSDYSGPFFSLWFFPIGVWFVQPRVNQLVTDQ